MYSECDSVWCDDVSAVCLAVGLDLLLFYLFSPPDCQLQTMNRQISSSSSGIGKNLHHIRAELNGDLEVQS